jgi:hypothetical protein
MDKSVISNHLEVIKNNYVSYQQSSYIKHCLQIKYVIAQYEILKVKGGSIGIK